MNKVLACLLALAFALTASTTLHAKHKHHKATVAASDEAVETPSTDTQVDPDAGDVATTAAKHYLEPTQADYDSASKAITAQQGAYVDAVKAWKASNGKDQDSMNLALGSAVFYFQRAWIYNNAADYLLESGTNLDAETLAKVEEYLDKGDAEVEACLAKNGDGRIKDARSMLAKNRDHLNERLGKAGPAAAPAEDKE